MKTPLDRVVDAGENQGKIIAARQRDFQRHAAVKVTDDEAKDEAKQLRALARRILAGETAAFTEAIVELNPFSELSDLGSSVHFTFHDSVTSECNIRVKGREVIPTEQKSLTASGKLSVKAMPKNRFHELYQDYVCACVMRLAREVFALLPVHLVLVTARVEQQDNETGAITETPALSVVLWRESFCGLNFESIDPSDTIELFRNRGSLKASRKTGRFETIEPFKIVDLRGKQAHALTELRRVAHALREEIKLETEREISNEYNWISVRNSGAITFCRPHFCSPQKQVLAGRNGGKRGQFA